MSEPVYLRALEASDLEQCHKWHNDGDLYKMLVGPFRLVSKQAEQAWLDRKTAFSPNELNLAICVKGSEEHVGNIYLREIDWIYRHAQLEIFIGERDKRSKGYGRSAMRQLLSHAFLDLGLKKLHLRVLAGNQAAINLYEKCGFIAEGRQRNHVFKQGGWKDVIAMGICADDDTAKKDDR
jgi:RimJ/RimL family protein N-acetyltransferase